MATPPGPQAPPPPQVVESPTPDPQYEYDDESKVTLSGLEKAHKSYQKLKTLVDNNCPKVVETCEHNRDHLRSAAPSYDKFLLGMLYNKEKWKQGADRTLYFTKVEFTPIPDTKDMEPIVKKSMERGRFFLTTHRILLLSAEEFQGLKFECTEKSDITQHPKKYGLTGNCRNVLQYQWIPLEKCVKSVELNVKIGIDTSTHMHGIRDDCCAQCFPFCWLDMCLKSWFRPNRDYEIVPNPDSRVLMIGAELPPFGHKYLIEIHIEDSVEIKHVKEFIAELQRYAPDLHTAEMMRQE